MGIEVASVVLLAAILLVGSQPGPQPAADRGGGEAGAVLLLTRGARRGGDAARRFSALEREMRALLQ